MSNCPVREEKLDAIPQKHYDVLIVGAGINGAEIARRSAAAGLSVLLIDKGDFASGCSSKTHKLISQNLCNFPDFNIAKIAKTERIKRYLYKNAPVQPQGIVIPVHEEDKNFISTEIWMLIRDIFSLAHSGRTHRFFGKKKTLRSAPPLANATLSGSAYYYEAKGDGARMVLEIINAAKELGTDCVNYCEFIEKGGDDSYKLRDKLNAKIINAKASLLVNSSGAWANKTLKAAKEDIEEGFELAKSVSLYVKSGIRSGVNAISINESNGEFHLLNVPWREGINIIGIIETDYNAEANETYANPADVSAIFEKYEAYFPGLYKKSDAIISSCALRPKIGQGASKKKAAKVKLSQSGDTLSIFYSGIENYTFTAEKALNLILKKLKRKRKEIIGRPLVSKSFYSENKLLLHEKTIEFLYRFYAYSDIAHRLNKRIENPDEQNYLDDERKIPEQLIEYFIEEEDARSVEDILLRRMGLAFILEDNAIGIAESVASILAKKLNYPHERELELLSSYKESIEKRRAGL